MSGMSFDRGCAIKESIGYLVIITRKRKKLQILCKKLNLEPCGFECLNRLRKSSLIN